MLSSSDRARSRERFGFVRNAVTARGRERSLTNEELARRRHPQIHGVLPCWDELYTGQLAKHYVTRGDHAHRTRAVSAANERRLH